MVSTAHTCPILVMLLFFLLDFKNNPEVQDTWYENECEHSLLHIPNSFTFEHITFIKTLIDRSLPCTVVSR